MRDDKTEVPYSAVLEGDMKELRDRVASLERVIGRLNEHIRNAQQCLNDVPASYQQQQVRNYLEVAEIVSRDAVHG